MHPNPAFRKTEPARSQAFARNRGFGALSVNGESHPVLAHIPFLLSEDGKTVEGHLARSNPILRLLKEGPKPALLAVNGPDAYISPDWYEGPDQVPTWNYVAVHLSGELSTRPPEDLRAHLDRLSQFFEARLAPKPIWLTEKVDNEALARMLRMIVPIRLEVLQLNSTWKLGQNKDDAMRVAAAGHLAKTAEDTAGQMLAQLMLGDPDKIA